VATPQRYAYHVEAGALDLPERPRKFLEALAAILEHGSYDLALDTYGRTSAKCGRCAASCQLYESTGDPDDIPCRRSELLLRVYRRYFTEGGSLRARLFDRFELTDEYLDEMAEAYYRCTACRRCKATCPMGIDHGLVTHLARWALAEVGVIPRALLVSVREQLDGATKNTSAIPLPALKDTCEFLEEELQDIYDAEVRYPFDVEGAEYVFFPAVSDYLMEADTLMGNAAVLQLTGTSWTIGEKNYDGINYGLFYSDRMMERIVRNMVVETRRLHGRKILVGECGHATRSAWYVPTFCGPDAPPVVNCLELAHSLLEAGRIPLKDEKIPERVTYHDPCNIARVGRITEQPREILKAICADFVEMTPNRTENYCCGGGGGTVSIDEIRSFRTGPMGARKARQIRDTGAELVVSPCANCKKQLRELCQDNALGDVEVVGVHDLLLRVIDFGAVAGADAAGTEQDEPPWKHPLAETAAPLGRPFPIQREAVESTPGAAPTAETTVSSGSTPSTANPREEGAD
jgi:Fe-S oxidoreductase